MTPTSRSSIPALPHLEETVQATHRYLATLERLTDDDLRRPSLLPSWTRAHVVTHLSRNAEGLMRLLHWGRTGEPTPMYTSQEVRDAEIAAGMDRSAIELIADAGLTAAQWEAAARGLPEDRIEAPVSRTLDSAPFPVRRIGVLRRTEVEVHHADLGLDYGPADWPEGFLDHLVKRRRRELAEHPGFLLRLDGQEPVPVGRAEQSAAVVEGSTADAVWWLLGRGDGAGVTCSEDQLPDLGKWA